MLDTGKRSEKKRKAQCLQQPERSEEGRGENVLGGDLGQQSYHGALRADA